MSETSNKVTRWVNQTMTMVADDHIPNTVLAKEFGVDAEEVCDVCGSVNKWFCNRAKRYGQAVMAWWQVNGRSGTWALKVGNDAAISLTIAEEAKDLRRGRTHLERLVHAGHVNGITSRLRRQIEHHRTSLEVAWRYRIAQYNPSSKADLEKELQRYLAPLRKEIEELLDESEDREQEESKKEIKKK